MNSNAQSESIKGPVINAVAVLVAALISFGGTIFGAFVTGHLTTPSDTREFQKTKQENTRLLQENEGLKEENAGLQQENSGLKHQNASLRAEVAQISTAARPQPQESQPQDSPAESTTETVDNFVSRLDGCEKSNRTVTCVVRVMNTKEDRVVRLFNNGTSIIDSAGNEQKAKVVSIGASTNQFPLGSAATTLPTNIPVKVTVSFGAVDSDINRLSILTLGIQSQMSNRMPDEEEIQFRDIPLH